METRTILQHIRSLQPEAAATFLNEILQTAVELASANRLIKSQLQFKVVRKGVSKSAKRFKIPTPGPAEVKRLQELPKRFSTYDDFWECSQPGESIRTPPVHDVLYAITIYCIRLDRENDLRVLQYRCGCVLICMLNDLSPDQYTEDTVSGILFQTGVLKDRATCRSQYSALLRVGRKLAHVARVLGLGALWCLPLQIPHSAWEHMRIESDDTTKLGDAIVVHEPQQYEKLMRGLLWCRLNGKISKQDHAFDYFSKGVSELSPTERQLLLNGQIDLNRRLEPPSGPLNLDGQRTSRDQTQLVRKRKRGSNQVPRRSRVDIEDPSHRPEGTFEITTLSPPIGHMTSSKSDSLNGLIKISRWDNTACKLETKLYRFYLQAVCTGRTLLKSNVYKGDVVTVANKHLPTKKLIAALSAFYLRNFHPSSGLKEFELRQVTEAADLLKSAPYDQRGVNATNMLRVNLAVARNDPAWVKLLDETMDSGTDTANIVKSRHAIFLMPFLPLRAIYSFQDLDYGFLVECSAAERTSMDGIIGTSREHLHFIFLVTKAAKCPASVDPDTLYEDIKKARAIVDDSEPSDTLAVATRTGTAYNLAVQLYFLARVRRLTPSHPAMAAISNELAEHLLALPASGDLYTGLHPAPAFPILCACTTQERHYKALSKIMYFIASNNPRSNVAGLCKILDEIWRWKLSSDEWENDTWWEVLVDRLYSFQNGDLVCLS